MYTLENEIIFEQTINRSHFICYIYPIDSIKTANEIIKKIRKKHYDATHNCYAYIIGLNGEISKNNDDGEPAGTAGAVIHDVLKKNKLTNVLAIVTRYFGGIKLGTGGLIRAYGSSVAKALKNINKIKIEKKIDITIEIDYSNYTQIKKNLESYLQIDILFTDIVTIKLRIPENNKKELIESLNNLTGGNIKIT